MEEIIIFPGIGVMHARVNAGFIAGQDLTLVIDTMNSPADGRDIAAFVAKSTPARIMAVVNTHNHADHTFGNQVFGVPVIASESCRKLMQENLAASWSPAAIRTAQESPGGERLKGLQVMLPHLTFRHGLTIHLGPAPERGGRGGQSERVAIIEHTGGHSPGHSIVRVPDAGVIFGGDLFFVGRYPFVRQAYTPHWITALRRIKDLAPEVLIPGHGPVCDTQRAAAEADRQIAYFVETKQQLADYAAKGLGLNEILARADEFPRAAEEGYHRLHRPNLETLYKECQKDGIIAG
ncbi:MAG: MBL fold metallo-hydrolase [Bacillota bacterium]|nr:MBL fold metallo-hydrolase [Bacillota bacterium]